MPFGQSQNLTVDEFRALVERAGLRIDAEEIERVRAAFETFREQLIHLHTAPVDGIEPAVGFRFPPAGSE